MDTEISNMARLVGSKIAISDEGGEYTYQELEDHTNRITGFLRDKGYGEGDRIGIYLSRGFKAVTIMLGVLKTGAAYIPISREWPAKRISHIIAVSEMCALITDKEIPFQDGYEFSGEIIETEEAYHYNAVQSIAKQQRNEQQMAYILYTSGSTGDPKGVCISHASFRYFVQWSVNEFHINIHDRIASISSFSFDLSIFEIFSGLVSGATVCIASEKTKLLPGEFSYFMQHQKISILYAVPSFLNGLTSYGALQNRSLSSLRLILFAGEVYWLQQFKKLILQLPSHIRYANLYGPTETNVCTFCYIDPEKLSNEEELPIGYVLQGTNFLILPQGTENSGELVVFGPSVMMQYWGDSPDKTEKHWHYADLGLGYRTGDIVTADQNGCLSFVCRNDDIVKVNGYRVALNEIKRCIVNVECVEEICVGLGKFANMQAIIVFAKASSSTTPKEIKKMIMKNCQEQLASYMLPNRIIVLEKFPYTDSGKIDSKKLFESCNLIPG